MIETPAGAVVSVGLGRLTYTGRRSEDAPVGAMEIGHLRDATPLWEARDQQGLRDHLARHGYLFIRGLHDRAEVLEGRATVLDHLREAGALEADESALQGYPKDEGVLAKGCRVGCIPFMEGRNSVTQSPAVARILGGPRPRAFFELLFGEQPTTFDYKWLRAMHSEGFTGAHCDSVYMSRGTPKLLTLWTPFQDTDINMGTLAILEGSHKQPGYSRVQETYGNMDVEAERLRGSGWFTEDPRELSMQFGGEWRTADFQAGDILVFTMRTIHMSTTNMTPKARISCDTRWHGESERSDPRYVGESVGHTDAKFGAHAQDSKSDNAEQAFVTMDQKKREWGFKEWVSAQP